MWLPEKIYEPLPYFLITAGILGLAGSFFAALYTGHWPDPAVIACAVSTVSLVMGAVTLQLRKEHRRKSAWHRMEQGELDETGRLRSLEERPEADREQASGS